MTKRKDIHFRIEEKLLDITDKLAKQRKKSEEYKGNIAYIEEMIKC